MKLALVTGASGGIGSACCQRLRQKGYLVQTPSSQELDFTAPASIAQLDLGSFDLVVNCAGDNRGTYKGFLDNSDQNQLNQILVNYVSPLMLIKRYLNCRDQGHFIYISSISVQKPEYYNVVNASCKTALQVCMDTIRQSNPNITISEICPGKTRTNMLYQNYECLRSREEIEQEYLSGVFLDASEVADAVMMAVDKQWDKIWLSP